MFKGDAVRFEGDASGRPSCSKVTPSGSKVTCQDARWLESTLDGVNSTVKYWLFFYSTQYYLQEISLPTRPVQRGPRPCQCDEDGEGDGVSLMMTGVGLMMTVMNVTDPLQGGKLTMLIRA